MTIADLLSLERIALQPDVSSKKRALEVLSEQLASAASNLNAIEIFDCLIARERLGSTGLGHGVAIPHARIAGVDDSVGAVLKLRQGVDYDALDQGPVDLLFALLVPEESTEVHLGLLSQLAEMFSDEKVLKELRTAQDSNTLLKLFDDLAPKHSA
ncbi:MAG: PTS IIA-like nitrogen regulatory protein PtsN [Gammaproteobacteria bacterium]|nr:PTS IIA-like nitrogen regulatory protein PtsN [Gammaproteobacteria bacterium]